MGDGLSPAVRQPNNTLVTKSVLDGWNSNEHAWFIQRNARGGAAYIPTMSTDNSTSIEHAKPPGARTINEVLQEARSRLHRLHPQTAFERTQTDTMPRNSCRYSSDGTARDARSYPGCGSSGEKRLRMAV